MPLKSKTMPTIPRQTRSMTGAKTAAATSNKVVKAKTKARGPKKATAKGGRGSTEELADRPPKKSAGTRRRPASEELIDPPPRPKPPASLVTLPIELRVYIYYLVFEKDVQYLSHFVEPPLCKAFPAIRNEALQEYLKHGAFRVMVRSNLIPNLTTLYQSPGYDDLPQPTRLMLQCYGNDYELTAGKFDLRRSIKLCLNSCSETGEAVIYCITFLSYNNNDAQDGAPKSVRTLTNTNPARTGPPYHASASITLIWGKATGLRLRKENPASYIDDVDFSERWSSRIANPFRAKAWQIVKREGFCGFTLRDLKELAREFRVDHISSWDLDSVEREEGDDSRRDNGGSPYRPEDEEESGSSRRGNGGNARSSDEGENSDDASRRERFERLVRSMEEGGFEERYTA